MASCIPALDDEIAVFLVAVFAQALEQGVIKTLMSMGDKSHPPNIARVLRERIERPSGSRAADQRDEIAALHVRDHSITSSARASSVGGTVRQSALAVFNVDNRLDWSTVTMAHSTFMSASRTMRV